MAWHGKQYSENPNPPPFPPPNRAISTVLSIIPLSCMMMMVMVMTMMMMTMMGELFIAYEVKLERGIW